MRDRTGPRILGLAGSPRPGGNTRLLLEWFLEGAAATGARSETVVLNDLSFRPCQACGGCDLTGLCVLRDDMLGVYDAVKRADGLVVSSPIHFGSLSAQTKAAIDRFQCFWAARYLLGRPSLRPEEGRKGFLLAVGGMEKGDRFIRNAEEVVKVFFTVLGVEHAGTLFFPGLDHPGEAARRPGVREAAVEAGRSFTRSLAEPRP
ncbi:MAG: flavodoxin family protein [Bacillota bacterium]